MSSDVSVFMSYTLIHIYVQLVIFKKTKNKNHIQHKCTKLLKCNNELQTKRDITQLNTSQY